ncbi:hypothetical protein HDU76_004529 [Blyttiomyces sp. JEL0837]|nr:hypothetical protein HDU76_004529 [Blyttiomyces sp. JEL0837]
MMYSPNTQRTGKRGDRVTKANQVKSSLVNLSRDKLLSEDTPTVRQRVQEAKKSGILDLSGLQLSMVPEDVWDIEFLKVFMIGNNNFTSVPSNLVESFPKLLYIDLSRNQISSVPSVLSELEDLLVLDLSGNPSLEGVQLPPSFGPIRDRVAIFVDNEEVADKGGEDGFENVTIEDGAVAMSTDDEEEGEDGEGEDDNEAVEAEYSTQRKQRDFAEDVALESRRFFRRLEMLEDHDELESNFKRMLAARDVTFIKYLHRRYGSSGGSARDDDEEEHFEGEDALEEITRRRNMKEQIGYARKEKDKFVAGERSFGRKVKVSMADNM